MSGIRPIIENAVALAIAEHPKYFTERGIEKAQTAIVRKVMAALVPRSGMDDAGADPAPPAEPVELVPLAVDPKSREGRAYTALRALAGAAAPFRMGDGTISIPITAQGERVWAFADAPAEHGFVTDKQQIGAWMEFFGETLPTTARRPITIERNGTSGILVPWPYPPSVTGKVYPFGEVAPE